jgi:hypothetical protein
MKLLVLSLSLLALPLVACGGTASDSEGFETAVDSDSEALVAPSYYVVTRRDLRRCVSPLCGGYYVKSANQATTTCADGSQQAECYVGSSTGMTLANVEAGLVVRGRMRKQVFAKQVLGRLQVLAAWSAATGSTADGTFYRGVDLGVRCITAPCPSFRVTELNAANEYEVGAVSLEQTEVPASEEALEAGHTALASSEGLLFVGGVQLPKCIPGTACGPRAVVSEFYLPVSAQEN